MPAGADTVVIQEMVRAADGVVVFRPPEVGQNVRSAGEDLKTASRCWNRAGNCGRPSWA